MDTFNHKPEKSLSLRKNLRPSSVSGFSERENRARGKHQILNHWIKLLWNSGLGAVLGHVGFDTGTSGNDVAFPGGYAGDQEDGGEQQPWQCVWAQSLSRVQVFVTSWTVAHQVSLSMGFSRQEYWSGLPLPSPGYLPDPRIEPKSPALQADSLLLESLGKPPALADTSANSDLVSWRFSDQPWRDCWAGHSIWRRRVAPEQQRLPTAGKLGCMCEGCHSAPPSSIENIEGHLV